MSGPTTALFGGDPLAILLSAAAIRAAEAVQDAYAQAAALEHEHTTSRDAMQGARQAAAQQGAQAMQAGLQAAENRLDQLTELAGRLGKGDQVQAGRPARPALDDVPAVSAYARGLQDFADALENILLTESARRMAQLPGQPLEIAIPASAAENLAGSVSQRLLDRIAHLGALPEHIQTLARELDNTPPGARADLLTTELRARIQAHVEAVQQQQVQQSTAIIVAHSLKELGYQVEEIADTLFVEGGMLHFRRQGWGNYMVRMRINAAAGSANFNVIRAVEAGNNERSVLDHIAEDRWCAEFPALMQALALHGVQLNVTRRLAAGELPVQLVDANKLPQFADAERTDAAPVKQSLLPIDKTT